MNYDASVNNGPQKRTYKASAGYLYFGVINAIFWQRVSVALFGK